MTERIRAKIALQEIEQSEYIGRASHPPMWSRLGLMDLLSEAGIRQDDETMRTLAVVKSVLRELSREMEVPKPGIGGPV